MPVGILESHSKGPRFDSQLELDHRIRDPRLGEGLVGELEELHN